MRVAIAISPYWIQRARSFAADLVRWYASPEGARSPSRSRSGTRGTEANQTRQALGKLGEIAVAQFFGLPPDKVIKWTVGHADDGTDLVLPFAGLLADVKTTEHWKRMLIWSREINDLYVSKRFDLLIGVSIDDRDWSRGWIDGWISKDQFFRQKRVADAITAPELEPNTWHVPKRELIDIRQIWRLVVEYDRVRHLRERALEQAS